MRNLKYVVTGGASRTAVMALLFVSPGITRSQDNPTQLAIFAEQDPHTLENYRLVWSATPGRRYEVRQSSDLRTWTLAPGFPALADGPAQQMSLVAEGRATFFQVRELDEQPPVIVRQYPTEGSFAVPRSAPVSLQLADATGVDPSSLSLTVADLGTFTVSDPRLTFTNGVLTFGSGAATPLGPYGGKLSASLVAADTVGNRRTNTWSFDLEVEPKVVTNLLVLGSPQAQLMGQRVGNTPTASLAGLSGPRPMGGGDTWTLESVAADRVVVAYTGAAAPAIAVQTYLCNLTPRTTDEIFYRKVTAVSDDPDAKRLTLTMEDVPLGELIETGSGSLSKNSIVYQIDTNNVIVKPRPVALASTFEHELVVPTFGVDWSKQELYDEDGVTLTLDEAYIWFTPTLTLAFETRRFSLQRFRAHARGEFTAALVPELSCDLQDLADDAMEFALYKHKQLIFLGMVGAVPVWLDLSFRLNAGLDYEVGVAGDFRAGMRQDLSLGLGADYVKGRTPRSVLWNHYLDLPKPGFEPFTFTIDGSARAAAWLVPQIDLRVNSLAGLHLNVNPRVELAGEAAFGANGLETAEWTLGAYADLNAGLSVIGVNQDLLPRLKPVRLYEWQWSQSYPPGGAPTIRRQPADLTVPEGSWAVFTVDAIADGPLTYQWYFRDGELLGQTARSLVLSGVSIGHAGPYRVRVTAGAQTLDSDWAKLVVIPNIIDPPLELVWCPPGTFTMGDPLHAHSVTLTRGFYVGRYEVTQREYLALIGNNPSRFTGDLERPVDSVTWDQAVAYCQALTAAERQAGRLPAGWEYRLPTEAQWEYAARAGTTTRFYWGDDVARQNDYGWSSANSGYTTHAVGTRLPNNWRLCDVSGNVWEWVMDWYAGDYGGYPGGSVTDPTGPASSTREGRASRGGGSLHDPGLPIWMRGYSQPSSASADCGFRVVLVRVP